MAVSAEPLMTDERLFTLITLLFGALIGALISNFNNWRTFKRETSRADSVERAREALRAQMGFVKLFALVETISSLVSLMEKCQDRYQGAEYDSMAKNQKFGGVVGLCDGVERIELQEVGFLFRTTEPWLFSSLLSFQRRVFALERHLEDYTDRRARLTNLLDEYVVEADRNAPHLGHSLVSGQVSVDIDRQNASLDRLFDKLYSEANACLMTCSPEMSPF